MNGRRLVAGHGYCLHELRPRHQWRDRQRDRRLRIAFATWHRSARDAVLVRQQVTRVLGQRRQSLSLRHCVWWWVAWTSQSVAMRMAAAAAVTNASARSVPRSCKKGAPKTRARSHRKGTARAANVHPRCRKVRRRARKIKKVGLHGTKAAGIAKSDTTDEGSQEEEATDDEDFHSAEEHDSCCAETDAGHRARLSAAVAAKYKRLIELHKELEGILHQAEALERHAARGGLWLQKEFPLLFWVGLLVD